MSRNRMLRKPLMLLLAGIVLALLLLPVGIALQSLGKPLDARHQSRAWSERFDQGAGYAAYVDWAGRQLREGLQRAALPRALAPYRLEPPADCPATDGKAHHNGIVLMHDLQESPYQLQELAEYFRERCFVVLVPLLPGHGTVPGDLLRSRWEQWVALQQLAARELAGEVNNLFLGGHGAGATLALLEGASNPEVDALILLAPVLQPLPLPWYAPLAGIAGTLVQGTLWGEVYPDELPYRQDSWPLALRAELNALVRTTRKALPGRAQTLPVFTVASMEDTEAAAEPILALMRELRHPDRRTVLYSRAAMALEAGVTWVGTERPDLALFGQGHEALVMTVGDRIFGQQGSYRDCRHYRAVDPVSWERCLAGEYQLMGEPAPDTLARGLLRKPGFNFFHVELQRELDVFLAPVARIPPVLVF